MTIVFPSDYFNSQQVDEAYTAEYAAVCNTHGLQAALLNYDEYIEGQALKIYSDTPTKGNCIYRGWMLHLDKYEELYKDLYAVGLCLLNSIQSYANLHLFPLVYEHIKKDTPKSLYFPDGHVIDWNLANETFVQFMVKDYVKSVKGSDFPAKFKTPVDPDTMTDYIERFKTLRGSQFSSGIVLKDYVSLKNYNGYTNEYRVFYLKGQLLSVCENSNQTESYANIPLDFLNDFSNLQSLYYTVDFAEMSDGTWIVIETGDGGVSGLPDRQNPEDYYASMQSILYH